MSCHKQLRAQYRPHRVSVVFLAESVPDPADRDHAPFFYSPHLGRDLLFRGLMEAIYGATKDDIRDSKPDWLTRFQSDGFWVLDTSTVPVNKMTSSRRRATLRAEAAGAAQRVLDAAPELGVFIVNKLVHEVIFDRLRERGVRLLHSDVIGYPARTGRAEDRAHPCRPALQRHRPRQRCPASVRGQLREAPSGQDRR